MLKTLVPIALGLTLTTSAVAAEPPTHPDLAISLIGPSTVTLDSGQPLSLHGKLINRSKRTAHRVVQPNDGSEMGWREPHVFFSAERKTDAGAWEQVKPLQVGRCGLFAFDWTQDVVSLPPGESLLLKDWLPSVERAVDLSQAGTYRVRMHYVYRAGRSAKGGGESMTVLPESLADMSAYSVTSKPMTLTVRRPLDLRLTLVGSPRAGEPAARVVELSLHNQTKRARPVSELGRGARLHFELRGRGSAPSFVTDTRGEVQRALAPGARQALALPKAATWDLSHSPEAFEIRATYYRFERGRIVETIHSNWVSVAKSL